MISLLSRQHFSVLADHCTDQFRLSKSSSSKLIIIRYNHCKLIKLTFFVSFTKNGIFKLAKCELSLEGFCILRSVTRIEWLKRMIAAVT